MFIWAGCFYNAWCWLYDKRHVGQRYRRQSGTDEEPAIGQRRDFPVGCPRISVRSVRRWIVRSSTIELVFNLIGRQFIRYESINGIYSCDHHRHHHFLFNRSGGCLSADEKNHLLASICAGNDIQLGRIAGMERHTGSGGLDRVLAIICCWCLLDNCIRYNICASGKNFSSLTDSTTTNTNGIIYSNSKHSRFATG